MAVTKWLHVNYNIGDRWVLPIWTARNRAAELGRVASLPSELGQLGLHVSTRLSMIEVLIQRINARFPRLVKLISKRKPHHEFTAADNAYVFDLPADFTYELLIDVDAILFEVNSCCELMNLFFESLYKHAGKKLPRKPIGSTIRQVLEAAGQDPAWFRSLKLYRNFFIHEEAPYFAVDLSKAHEGTYDLLIMKRNLHSFDDEKEFVKFSKLTEIVRGFQNAKPAVQRHLAGLFS